MIDVLHLIQIGGAILLNERIKNQEVMKKVVSAEVAANLVKDGMVIGVSGFSPSG